MKKIFTVLLLIICLTNVKAYENDQFTIDIPDGFTEESKDNLYKWTNGNKYISITVGDNPEEYNIEEYTDKDLQKQRDYLRNIYSSGLKDYNMTVEVSDMTREEINNYSILTYDTYWPSKDLTGYNIYQRGAVYTTKNHIYTILISDEKEITKDEFDSLLKSFNLKDEQFGYKSKLLTFILVFGTILGVIGYFIENKKKRA